MGLKEAVNTSNLKLSILKRVVIGGLVLFAGFVMMIRLAGLKEPPAEATNGERPLYVEVVAAAPEDITVQITGFGEVQALNSVSVSPEVPGTILELNPRLEIGEVVKRSSLLFRVDPSNYIAARDEARGSVAQWESAVERIEKRYTIDVERLKTIERNRNLARSEYNRIRDLYDKDSVGTRSGVDRAEQAYNTVSDQADQMAQMVALYPIRIREAKSSLESVRARLSLAQTNLERCDVNSPFNGRVKAVALEEGQYVTPGQSVLVLADDSMLEIHVPLDSRDVRDWLLFDSNGEADPSGWFAGLKPVRCSVRWTEMADGSSWEGRLHRVVKFDPRTRTVTVAIRIHASDARAEHTDSIPLVEGMFCSVAIPGKTMRSVIPLPRWAVSFNDTVYVASGSRLKTVPVVVLRIEGDTAYISEGLNPGDLAIVTRLADPLENALLSITTETDGKNRP